MTSPAFDSQANCRHVCAPILEAESSSLATKQHERHDCQPVHRNILDSITTNWCCWHPKQNRSIGLNDCRNDMSPSPGLCATVVNRLQPICTRCYIFSRSYCCAQYDRLMDFIYRHLHEQRFTMRTGGSDARWRSAGSSSPFPE